MFMRIVLFAFFVYKANCQAPDPSVNNCIEQIAALMQTLEQAFSFNSVTMMEHIFDQNAVVTFDGQHYNGIREIENWFRSLRQERGSQRVTFPRPLGLTSDNAFNVIGSGSVIVNKYGTVSYQLQGIHDSNWHYWIHELHFGVKNGRKKVE